MYGVNSQSLEEQLIDRYGPLMSQPQLAEFLDRSLKGLRFAMCHPKDEKTRLLKEAATRVGRRVYYPAGAVARIVLGEHAEMEGVADD